MSTPKQLKDFPFVLKAFQLIYDDQPYPPHMRVHLMPKAKVPKAWLARFSIAETTLKAFDGKTLRHVGIRAGDLYAEGMRRGEIKLTEPALDHVVLPVNDLQVRIYKAARIPKTAATITDKVLYEFFDGMLRAVFQSEARRAAQN
jgi:hypothetical protein